MGDALQVLDAAESDSAGAAIVQFSAQAFYCQEAQGLVEVDVVRIGRASNSVAVAFTTESGSAMAGKDYTHAAGSVCFAPGECIQKIRIHVVGSKIWRPTLYFMIRLLSDSPAGWNGAFQQCRIWILHQGSFPTSAIDEQFDGEKMAPASEASFHSSRHGSLSSVDSFAAKLRLLYEFYRKCLSVNVVREGTIKMLLIDSLDNTLFLWQLALSVYFIDHVLKRSIESSLESPEASSFDGLRNVAVGVGLLHGLPLFLINYLKEQSSWFGVAGAARKSLQVDILRLYLSFTDASRNRVGPAGFIEAFYRDAVEVVDNGYMALIQCAAALGRITAILLFTAYNTPYALPLQLSLPIFMMHLVHEREEGATLLRLKYFKAQNRMLDHADNVTRNFQLIRDYHLRPAMGKKMGQLVDDVNYFANAVTAHTTRSRLALPLASVLLAGALMASAPSIIPYLGMTSGLFLATLAATQQMGAAAEHLFAALMQIGLAISALLKLFSYMNLPTEADVAMLASNKQRERGRKVAEDSGLQARARKADPKWQQRLGLSEPDVLVNRWAGGKMGHDEEDGMLIEMIGVGLHVDAESSGRLPRRHRKYARRASGVGTKAFELDTRAKPPPSAALRDVNLQLRQGRIYAVVGPHGGGKSNFLRLLGKAAHPTHGEVFIPPHLSVIHVEQAPQVFSTLTLFENLVLGYPTAAWPAVESVVAVCSALGLPLRWLQFLRQTAPSSHHNSSLARISTDHTADQKGGLQPSDALNGEPAPQLESAPPLAPARPKNATLALDVKMEGEEKDADVAHTSNGDGWAGQLSLTDLHILQLARAIIANPHILVLHRPLTAFENTLGTRVARVLRRFVDERGSSMLMNGAPGILARTIVYTCATSDGHALEAVDGIVVLGRPEGGASVLDVTALLDGVHEGEPRSEVLSRQCAELVPANNLDAPSSDAVAAADERSVPHTPAKLEEKVGTERRMLRWKIGNNTPESTPASSRTPTSRGTRAAPSKTNPAGAPSSVTFMV